VKEVLIRSIILFAFVVCSMFFFDFCIKSNEYPSEVQNQIEGIITNQNIITAQQEEINKKLENLETRLNEKWTDKEYVDNRIDELGSMIQVLDEMCGRAQKNYDNR